jgi:two-component system catabolic regulation response regulator CreB
VTKILIVEDEISIADTLVFALESEGYAVEWVRLGRDGVDRASKGELAFVVLDIGLPDQSGFEVCKAIRRFSEVPILFLSARGDEIDRVVGLEIGADDYVVKPFSPREVVSRVRTILKRTQRDATPPGAPRATAGETPKFQLDRAALKLRFLGQPLTLTAQEFKLLEALLSAPERVFSRAQLLSALGSPPGASYERNIDTHIKSLRAKLREVSTERDPIQTHRGFGYSYRPEPV